MHCLAAWACKYNGFPLQVLGKTLPYDTKQQLRQRLADVAPHFAHNDKAEKALWLNGEYFKVSISVLASLFIGFMILPLRPQHYCSRPFLHQHHERFALLSHRPLSIRS